MVEVNRIIYVIPDTLVVYLSDETMDNKYRNEGEHIKYIYPVDHIDALRRNRCYYIPMGSALSTMVDPRRKRDFRGFYESIRDLKQCTWPR